MLRQQLLDSDHQDGGGWGGWKGDMWRRERTRKWLRPAG